MIMRHRLVEIQVAVVLGMLFSVCAASAQVTYSAVSPNTTGRALYQSSGPGYGMYIPDVSQPGRPGFFPGHSPAGYSDGPWVSRGRYATVAPSNSPIFLTSLNFPGVYGAFASGVTPLGNNVTPMYTLMPTNLPSANPVGAPYVPLEFTTLADRPAVLKLHLPSDASLSINGTPLSQTGTERQFTTRPLPPGGDYIYEVIVRWNRDGRTITRDQQIRLRAGERLDLDFLEKTPYVRQEERPTLRTIPPEVLQSGTPRMPRP